MYNLTPTEQIDLLGYCLIEDAISDQLADQLAGTCRGLHEGLRGQLNLEVHGAYETLFGLLNYDQAALACVLHPAVLAVVQGVLGPDAQVAECCSKLVKPGASWGGVHCDSTADLPLPLPETPWIINSMWMLTDFTAENGATVVAPCSHRTRQRPPQGMRAADKHLVPVTGRRGAVFLWQGGTWHASGANTTRDQTRVGLNIAYYPVWWNLQREANHQTIKKHVYDQMPPQVQAMLRARHEQ